MLMHYTVVFEKCVGLPLLDCENIIQAEVAANPILFENRTSLEVDVMNVRTSEAPNYNLVGLRTNLEETHVVGVLGDGMVFYPWDWCLAVLQYDPGIGSSPRFERQHVGLLHGHANWKREQTR